MGVNGQMITWRRVMLAACLGHLSSLLSFISPSNKCVPSGFFQELLQQNEGRNKFPAEKKGDVSSCVGLLPYLSVWSVPRKPISLTRC